MIKTIDISRSQFAAKAAEAKQLENAREVKRVLRETRRAAEYPGYEPDLPAETLCGMTPERRAKYLAEVGLERYREQLRAELRTARVTPNAEGVESQPQPQIASMPEVPDLSVLGFGGKV